MPRQLLSRKLNGASAFNLQEMHAIREIFGGTLDELSEIDAPEEKQWRKSMPTRCITRSWVPS